MLKKLSTQSLAKSSAQHPWYTIGVWVLAVVIFGFLTARFLPSALTTEFEFSSKLESTKGRELLKERLRPEKIQEMVIVRSETVTVDDPAFKSFVESLYTDLTALGPEVVEGGQNYYQTGAEPLVSADRHITIMPIVMTGTFDDAMKHVDQLLAVVHAANGQQDFEVLTTGGPSFATAMMQVAEKDAQKAETIGIPVAMIILFLVFGALAAAGVPLIMAIVSMVVAFGATAVIGQFQPFFFNVANLITMMGLAVGIDYSLFIVSRYREERRNGLNKQEAIERSGATSSRAVFFSGTTVILSMAGLGVLPGSSSRSMIGAILVVAAAIGASLTFLPALLSLMGDKIDALRIPFLQKDRSKASAQRSGGFWDWQARLVMRHPVICLVLAGGLLIAAIVPVLGMKTGSAGISTLPNSMEAKRGYTILEKHFSAGLNSPAEVVIDGQIGSPAVQDAIQRLQHSLQTDPAYGPTQLAVNPSGDLAHLSVIVPGDPTSQKVSEAVKALRSRFIPQAFAGVDATVYVTGETAAGLDNIKMTEDGHVPLVVFVLGFSFILLTVVFRSLIVPIKAILMNLLSVGASYGLLVLVSQKGVGASLLGLQKVDAVEAWLPAFLFAILFGLSMDYHVFLLSRIREHFDQTGDNSEAVAHGLRSTGGMITGAAVIMVAVFAGFAMGDLVMMQQLGFGLAVAVFLDATVVRSILVPASMQLLGKWNWYLPGFLSWLPDLRVEGTAVAPQPVPAIKVERGGTGAHAVPVWVEQR